MPHISGILAKNIVRLRGEMSQEMLSELSGVGIGTIGKLEKGKVWFGKQTIQSLAKALKVNEVELFIDHEMTPKPSIREAWKIINEYLENQKQI